MTMAVGGGGELVKFKKVEFPCFVCSNTHQISEAFFYCLFNVRPSNFEVYLRSNIITSLSDLCSKPLMRLSYIHLSYGYSKSLFPCGESNSEPINRQIRHNHLTRALSQLFQVHFNKSYVSLVSHQIYPGLVVKTHLRSHWFASFYVCARLMTN